MKSSLNGKYIIHPHPLNGLALENVKVSVSCSVFLYLFMFMRHLTPYIFFRRYKYIQLYKQQLQLKLSHYITLFIENGLIP